MSTSVKKARRPSAARKKRSTEAARERNGAKRRIGEYLMRNIGRVVDARALRAISGDVSEWGRRTRELRDHDGWKILTHNDRSDLKPGQYLLVKAPPKRKLNRSVRGMSARLRATVLDRDGFTCQMCGLTPGDVDSRTRRKVRLHIGHIKDKSLGGRDEFTNLRTLCSSCNQGAKNVTSEKPTTIWLLSQIRRAGQAEQRSVLNFLMKKFNP